MESIGEYLKREREFRSISLQEISGKTKIRKEILTALEEGRLDSLASPVFIKGFLRAYAGYVGLDPNEVVLRYETQVKEEEDLKTKKAAQETPSRWWLKYVMLPVSILVFLGALLFLALHQPRDGEREVLPQQTTESSLPTVSRTEPLAPIQEEQGDVISPTYSPRDDLLVNQPPVHPSRPLISFLSEMPSGIELKLNALEEAWIQIQIDQKPPTEILLKPGQSISRQGESKIDIKIGNAGGVKLTLNGKDLGPLGESGNVVHLSITPEEVKVGR